MFSRYAADIPETLARIIHEFLSYFSRGAATFL